MARRCTVCGHPKRKEIDAALAAPDAVIAAISRDWSLSADALARHKDGHLPATLAKASAAAEVAHADDLFDKVAGLEADARRLRATAEEAGDVRTALMAVRELMRIVELLAKLKGELPDGITINVNTAQAWLEVRQTVFVALLPYPEARVAVAAALEPSSAD